MNPRAHQAQAIDMLRDSLRRGCLHPLLWLATGAGKTFIAALILRMALDKGKRIIFCVDAISLIDQTVQAFYRAGIPEIGVIQANHPMTDYSKPVQVASVQTLSRRGLEGLDADLVIVDEAHRMHTIVSEWMEAWDKIPFIGLSATPWSKGLGKLYDDLICPISMQELIDLKYLVPPRVFAPSIPDLSNVKTVRGDYHEGQIADVMGEEKLIADVVGTWLEKGENRPTLVFAVDRAHARKLEERFKRAGVGAGYIDANTSVRDRKAIEAQLGAGEIQVVCNVGCLTTGIDWAVGAIVLARPTKSEMLFVQMVGRGLRVNPPWEDCLVFDHAGNCLRLGMPQHIAHDELDTTKKGQRQAAKKKPSLPVECGRCDFLMEKSLAVCPNCGQERVPLIDVEEGAGDLEEVNAKKVKASIEDKQEFFSALLMIARERNYSTGWAAHKYREKFGVWPNTLAKVPGYVPQSVRGWVKSRQIAYAKRRQMA